MSNPVTKRTTKTVAAMISLDQTLTQPLHEQIYSSIRRDILQGKLSPGDRLPSTRTLSEDLRVARNTVMTAFDKLRLEGYVVGQVGGGTYVAETLPESTITPVLAGSVIPLKANFKKPTLSVRGRTLAETDVSWAAKSSTGIAFRVGAPAFDAFPYTLWNRLETGIWRNPTRKLVAYGDPAGYKPLREAVAKYLTTSRGVKCDASRVLIVDGSQQALDLAARVLADAGQRAWLEDPGYLGARAALRGNGVEIVPVPVDDEGLIVPEGIRRCPSPAMIYVTPSRQFPLGSVMSLKRRFELLSLANDSGAWIIEDDYDSEFRYTGNPIQALQGIDTTGRVIYTGTFSKILFPSLRLGYMVVPEELRSAFLAARVITNLQVSTPPQAVLTEFMEGGHMYRHLRRMRKLYAERQEVLVNAVREEMRDLIELKPTDAGMHLIGWLRGGLKARNVSAAAAAVGIDVNPLSTYCLDPCEREGILLGYTGVRPPILWRSARELAVAIRNMRARDVQSA